MKDSLNIEAMMDSIMSVLSSRYNINDNKLDKHWTEHYVVTKMREIVEDKTKGLKNTDYTRCPVESDCPIKGMKSLELIVYINMLYLKTLVPALVEFDVHMDPFAFLKTYYHEYGGESQAKDRIILLLSADVMFDAQNFKKDCMSLN